MQQQIPNIKLVAIKGGFSQCIHVVVPDLVAEKVLDFIKTID